MSVLLDKCRELGVDVEGVMERFMEDEDLFLMCLEKFYMDVNFEKLGETLKNKEYKDAFICIHSLKGVAANLGLTALYQVSSDFTEKLRADDYEGLDEMYNLVCQERERMKVLLP